VSIVFAFRVLTFNVDPVKVDTNIVSACNVDPINVE
jgi:hypothetical protein